ncbi:C40 family peptidase [Halomonas organivorans]|uniref:Cell wall-associated NlpC family hydrolase n=1 Tax=Halomonas organivorans TaxID=257772 RepID=A0A7W5BWB2_9GAMM|nr:NlpC/P60 family protein [Halomonas organivorans]MBB3140281.1 cell wall-associated NlpC family hydrolase [Halomonas organivorans]
MSKWSRLALGGLALLLLSGCAASGGHQAPVDDYFARDLPGLPGGPRMSPVDNPVLALRGLRQPPPAQVRQALLSEHQRWLGTPYRLGGTTRRGIDCSALVQRVFSEAFGLSLPRTTSQQVREGEAVSRDALRPGDLVFFRPPGYYRHVGIYVGQGRFLHASTSRGVKLSSLDNRYWRRHYWQARRPLDVVHMVQRIEDRPFVRGEG